jgi:long-chain acyl-CoA synthetase
LGLDSLGRVQLQAELEQRLGLTIDDETLERVITLGDLRRELGLDGPVAGPAIAGSPSPASATEETHSTPPRPQPAHLITDHREAGEDDIYPRWPWSPLGRLVRNAFTELIAQPLVWILAAPRVERPARLEPGRPVLLIANHVTTYDVSLILYALPGPMRRRIAAAMAANMLRDWRHFRNLAPGLNWLGPVTYLLVTGLFNAFPLPRSAGFRRSFQHAGEVLDRGFNVLVFPEGHRTETGLQPFRPGIGLLVRESGTPVIPVALAGLNELKAKGKGWFRSGKLSVRVGEPIEFAPGDSAEQITSRLYETLRDMLART